MNSRSNNNIKAVRVGMQDIANPEAMKEFMIEGSAPSRLTVITTHPSIPYTKMRRAKLTEFIYFKFKINERPRPR